MFFFKSQKLPIQIRKWADYLPHFAYFFQICISRCNLFQWANGPLRLYSFSNHGMIYIDRIFALEHCKIILETWYVLLNLVNLWPCLMIWVSTTSSQDDDKRKWTYFLIPLHVHIHMFSYSGLCWDILITNHAHIDRFPISVARSVHFHMSYHSGLFWECLVTNHAGVLSVLTWRLHLL